VVSFGVGRATGPDRKEAEDTATKVAERDYSDRQLTAARRLRDRWPNGYVMSYKTYYKLWWFQEDKGRKIEVVSRSDAQPGGPPQYAALALETAKWIVCVRD
jgi:hypothetical protein